MPSATSVAPGWAATDRAAPRLTAPGFRGVAPGSRLPAPGFQSSTSERSNARSEAESFAYARISSSARVAVRISRRAAIVTKYSASAADPVATFKKWTYSRVVPRRTLNDIARGRYRGPAHLTLKAVSFRCRKVVRIAIDVQHELISQGEDVEFAMISTHTPAPATISPEAGSRKPGAESREPGAYRIPSCFGSFPSCSSPPPCS